MVSLFFESGSTKTVEWRDSICSLFPGGIFFTWLEPFTWMAHNAHVFLCKQNLKLLLTFVQLRSALYRCLHLYATVFSSAKKEIMGIKINNAKFRLSLAFFCLTSFPFKCGIFSNFFWAKTLESCTEKMVPTTTTIWKTTWRQMPSLDLLG